MTYERLKDEHPNCPYFGIIVKHLFNSPYGDNENFLVEDSVLLSFQEELICVFVVLRGYFLGCEFHVRGVALEILLATRDNSTIGR